MNIGEIAQRAGVSRSTVSYALSGKRTVSADTRRRIQEVIDELGYRPNAAARALKEGRSRTIGLVIPPATRRLTYMQLEFVASVLEAAARADLDVLVSSSGAAGSSAGDDHDRSFDRVIDSSRVDGIILMEILLEDPRVARLQRAGMPFVTIGHTAKPEGTCWVDVDYATLIGRCVQHLADLGHQHVALINRSAELLAAGYCSAHRVRQGFADATVQRGLSGVEYPCGDDGPSGDACMTELLRAHPEVTAVATVNEAALPGFQRALDRAGLAVPRDFSIVGIADRQWAEEFHPPLTAADVPAAKICADAVDMLLERIADPAAAARHLLLAPPISLRDSTGRVPSRSKELR